MAGFEELKAKWAGAEWKERSELAVEVGKLGTSEAEAFLIDVLREKKENYFVRGFAALALSEARDARSIAVLAATLNPEAIMDRDENPFVREMCAEALGNNSARINRMGEEAREEVLGVLRKALEDSPEVVAKAIVALGKFWDMQSLRSMYGATTGKLGDFGPIALAMAEMGIRDLHAVGIYISVLETSADDRLVKRLVEKVEGLLRVDASMDEGLRLSSALRLCKRKLAAMGRPPSESIVDEVLGVRFSRPKVKEGMPKVPPPLPAKKAN